MSLLDEKAYGCVIAVFIRAQCGTSDPCPVAPTYVHAGDHVTLRSWRSDPPAVFPAHMNEGSHNLNSHM